MRIKLSLFFILALIAYGALFQLSRSGGAEALLALTAIGLTHLRPRKKDVGFSAYAPFFLYSLLILLASLAGIMPTAWTTLYDMSAAIRQWSWILLFPLLALAAVDSMSRSREFLERNALALAIVVFAMGRISLKLSDSPLDTENFLTLYGLKNENSLFICLAIAYIYSKKPHLIRDVAILLVLLLLSGSAGSAATLIVLLVIRLTKWPQLPFAAILVSLLGLLVFAPFNYVYLDSLDSNSGLRAILWRDAIAGIQGSLGLGVGFGTEAISDLYLGMRSRDFSIVTAGGDSIFYVGAHSLFYEIAFRQGVAGLCLFSLWFFHLSRRSQGLDLPIRREFFSLLTVFVVANLINVGMSTPSFMIGMIFCISRAIMITNRKSKEI